jgi:hypothetical protein
MNFDNNGKEFKQKIKDKIMDDDQMTTEAAKLKTSNGDLDISVYKIINNKRWEKYIFSDHDFIFSSPEGDTHVINGEYIPKTIRIIKGNGRWKAEHLFSLINKNPKIKNRKDAMDIRFDNKKNRERFVNFFNSEKSIIKPSKSDIRNLAYFDTDNPIKQKAIESIQTLSLEAVSTNAVKSKERVKAERRLLELMDAFDNTKFNSDQYKKLFESLSEAQFKKLMYDIYDEKQYVTIEIDPEKNNLTLSSIFDICEKLNFETHKYVIYNDNKDSEGNPVVSPYPIPIAYLPVKRLQQMLSKKNSASAKNSIVNELTGTVTGDDKSARINDTQLFGLITGGQFNTIKEFMGPRSDDSVAKKKMMKRIEENGYVRLSQIKSSPRNKQSYETMRVFLRGVGLNLTNTRENEETEGDEE